MMIWMHFFIINTISPAEKTCLMLAAAALFTGQQTTENKPITDWSGCYITVATHSWIRSVFMQIGDLPQNISDSLVSMSEVLWSNMQKFMEIWTSSSLNFANALQILILMSMFTLSHTGLNSESKTPHQGCHFIFQSHWGHGFPVLAFQPVESKEVTVIILHSKPTFSTWDTIPKKLVSDEKSSNSFSK